MSKNGKENEWFGRCRGCFSRGSFSKSWWDGIPQNTLIYGNDIRCQIVILLILFFSRWYGTPNGIKHQRFGFLWVLPHQVKQFGISGETNPHLQSFSNMCLGFQWQTLVESASARFSSPTMAWPQQRRSCQWEGAAFWPYQVVRTCFIWDRWEHLKTCKNLGKPWVSVVIGWESHEYRLCAAVFEVDVGTGGPSSSSVLSRSSPLSRWQRRNWPGHVVTRRDTWWARHHLKQYQDSVQWCQKS